MEDIRQKLEYFEKLLEKVERLLSKVQIEGSLSIIKRKNRVMYYHVVSQNSKISRKYLSKKDSKIIKMLVQKKYYFDLKKFLLKKINYLKVMIENRVSGNIDDILSGYPIERKELISPIVKTKTQRISDWLKTPFTTNPFRKDLCIYSTNCGLKVRSKSESMISDILTIRELYHLYKIALNINGKVIYPDFAIIHPETLEIVFWEHFGLMDDEKYRKDALERIILLEQSGYIRGKNLIVTFEASGVPLNKEWINKLIDEVFFSNACKEE